MNIFSQYGLREVADVTFYSIIRIGDEEFYIPVLYLDTLKISDLDKKESKVNASSGYGNHKILSWNFGKDITLKIDDALFSPASMSLTWGGWLDSKLSKFSMTIAKISVAQKYYNLNYSPYAYPSPELTDEEWEVIFKAQTDLNTEDPDSEIYWVKFYDKSVEKIEENRVNLKKEYYKRSETFFKEDNIQNLVNKIIDYIKNPKKFSNIITKDYKVEVIDRMEKCIVDNKEGFEISILEQKKNILRRLQNDEASSYTIYYDDKTLMPLVHINEDGLYENWDGNEDKKFKLKYNTSYLKWTRTIKKKNGDNGILGRELVITADTFPKYFRIEGQTYIREQQTGKDQPYQFIIPKAKLNTDTSFKLEATGDPTVFSMTIDVIAQENDEMMKMIRFDTEQDCAQGGNRIVPQLDNYTRTYTELLSQEQETIDLINEEIY